MSTTNIAPLSAGGKISGIIPTTIEEVFRLATAISKSGLAPANMNTPEKLTVAIMQGLEIGLPPMMAVNRIAVVNGRPTLYGEAIPALLLSRGFRLVETMEGTGEKRLARCRVIRPDGDAQERTFSVEDAKTASLWGKAGPWKQYPDRMLQMRARGFAARDHAADVLGGLYLTEEAEDIPNVKDITPKPDNEPAKERVAPPVEGERKALPPIAGAQGQHPQLDVEHLAEPEQPGRSGADRDQPSEADKEPDTEEPIADADGFVKMIEGLASKAKTKSQRQAVYAGYVVDMAGRLPPEALARVKAILDI